MFLIYFDVRCEFVVLVGCLYLSVVSVILFLVFRQVFMLFAALLLVLMFQYVSQFLLFYYLIIFCLFLFSEDLVRLREPKDR